VAGVKDTFSVPVLAEGDGQFEVDGGYPIVQNVVPGQANNASVYVNGPNAFVQLSDSATLECDSDFYLADGVLETMECRLLPLPQRFRLDSRTARFRLWW
jgi:hypothetical protein